MMELKNLDILKEDERGKIYDCGNFKLIIRKKNSVSADHVHDKNEILFLIEGKIELTVNNETKIVEAPIKISIPNETYHKIKALTDIKLIEIK